MPPRTPAARATPGRRATDRPAAGNELRPAASHDVGAGRAAGAAGRRPDAVGHSGPPVLRVVPPAVDRDEPDDTVPAVPSSPEPDRHADAAPDPGGEPSRRPADGRREVEHQVGNEGVGHGVPAGEEAARDATGLEESPVAAAPPRRRAGGQDWADVLFGAPSASPPGRRPPS